MWKQGAAKMQPLSHLSGQGNFSDGLILDRGFMLPIMLRLDRTEAPKLDRVELSFCGNWNFTVEILDDSHHHVQI